MQRFLGEDLHLHRRPPTAASASGGSRSFDSGQSSHELIPQVLHELIATCAPFSVVNIGAIARWLNLALQSVEDFPRVGWRDHADKDSSNGLRAN